MTRVNYVTSPSQPKKWFLPKNSSFISLPSLPSVTPSYVPSRHYYRLTVRDPLLSSLLKSPLSHPTLCHPTTVLILNIPSPRSVQTCVLKALTFTLRTLTPTPPTWIIPGPLLESILSTSSPPLAPVTLSCLVLSLSDERTYTIRHTKSGNQILRKGSGGKNELYLFSLIYYTNQRPLLDL